MTDSDALATIKTMVLDAIAETSIQTGLLAGPQVTLLMGGIVRKLFDAHVRWAVAAYLREIEATQEQP